MKRNSVKVDVEVDTTELKDGTHTITVKLVSQFNKVLLQQSKKITIHKYDSRLTIEQPSANESVKTTVKVNGWALSEDKNDKIEVRVDNKVIGTATRYARDDIFKVDRLNIKICYFGGIISFMDKDESFDVK